MRHTWRLCLKWQPLNAGAPLTVILLLACFHSVLVCRPRLTAVLEPVVCFESLSGALNPQTITAYSQCLQWKSLRCFILELSNNWSPHNCNLFFFNQRKMLRKQVQGLKIFSRLVTFKLYNFGNSTRSKNSQNRDKNTFSTKANLSVYTI